MNILTQLEKEFAEMRKIGLIDSMAYADCLNVLENSTDEEIEEWDSMKISEAADMIVEITHVGG